jgi:hypothetical protein
MLAGSTQQRVCQPSPMLGEPGLPELAPHLVEGVSQGRPSHPPPVLLSVVAVSQVTCGTQTSPPSLSTCWTRWSPPSESPAITFAANSSGGACLSCYCDHAGACLFLPVSLAGEHVPAQVKLQSRRTQLTAAFVASHKKPAGAAVELIGYIDLTGPELKSLLRSCRMLAASGGTQETSSLVWGLARLTVQGHLSKQQQLGVVPEEEPSPSEGELARGIPARWLRVGGGHAETRGRVSGRRPTIFENHLQAKTCSMTVAG